MGKNGLQTFPHIVYETQLKINYRHKCKGENCKMSQIKCSRNSSSIIG